jgi:hypothetical protein
VSRVVTVVDTSDFVDLWMTDQKLGERKDIAGDAVDECSAGRSVVELLAEQVMMPQTLHREIKIYPSFKPRMSAACFESRN